MSAPNNPSTTFVEEVYYSIEEDDLCPDQKKDAHCVTLEEMEIEGKVHEQKNYFVFLRKNNIF